MQAGPDVRVGAASLTLARNHYDGGFSTAGIFSLGLPTLVWIDGQGPDEPDAAWAVTVQQCEWVDHAAWLSVELVFVLYPALPDKHLRLDLDFVDSSISDSVTLSTGSWVDGTHIAQTLPKGSVRYARARFERSGNFDSAAVGTGGLFTQGPPAGSIVPSIEFTASEWVGSECETSRPFTCASEYCARRQMRPEAAPASTCTLETLTCASSVASSGESGSLPRVRT